MSNFLLYLFCPVKLDYNNRTWVKHGLHVELILKSAMNNECADSTSGRPGLPLDWPAYKWWL